MGDILFGRTFSWLHLVGCLGMVFLLPPSVMTQTNLALTATLGNIYSNPALGFEYAIPPALQDETKIVRSQIKARASATHNNKALDLLLSMSSGPDSNARIWRALTIETYPRQGLSDLDDESAKAKVSAWVAQSSSLPGKPRNVILAGQNFAVFVFGVQSGKAKKGAVIWTTIRRGKLLSFGFVANA